MTNKIFTLIIAALLMSNVSFGKIFRVGYTGPQVAGVDFTTADAAVTAASANDTIQIYPKDNYYLGQLSKKLVIIGVGYFLDKNIGLQVAATSSILTVTLDAGGSGSVFEGLEINPSNYGGGSVQNILFKRCKISGSFYVYNPTAKINNITFSQCYFPSPISFQCNDNTTIDVIDFQNCIINGYASTFYINGTGIITNISFENCDVNGEQASETGAISVYYRNCIFRYEPTTTSNDVFDYCTFENNNATHYVAGTSNQFGKDFLTVFSGGANIQAGTQWDASYTLKSGSPAIGYGRDNSNNPIDAGAYGSINPYKLSGIPPIPAFYKLTAPSTNASSNPYTITFSVRANN